MTVAPAVVSINSGLGSVYFARVVDIDAARSRGERDVPLCMMDGSLIPSTSVQRDRLRLSTIDASTIAPFPPPSPVPVQPPAQAPESTMKPADKIMLGNAKRTVDLAAFLALYGFQLVGEKDSYQHRILVGPEGVKVRVSVVRASGDWVYEDLRVGGGGDILQACEKLLGMSYGRAMAAVRAAGRNPPPPLPNRRGQTAAVVDYQPRPQRTLAPLGKRGRSYLTEMRCLHPSTLDAFCHALHSNVQGNVVFAHNRSGDGEERGPGWQSFHGSRRDGPNRGRSLYVALPHAYQEPPAQIIVAESGIDALSAWEMLDAEAQPMTAIASTGGGFSEPGEAKLERVLNRMVEHHGSHGAPILVDATDAGEKRSEQRTARLQKLAERVGAIYYRAEPSHQVKDWNEELQAVKAAAQEAQEAAQAAEGGRSYLVADPESEEVQEGDGRRIGGRRH